MAISLTLEELLSYLNKYNELPFDKKTSNKIAKTLIQKAGFTDKKDYSYIPNLSIEQTYHFSTGMGTLWKYTDSERYKIEIGKAVDNEGFTGLGWFSIDIESI